MFLTQSQNINSGYHVWSTQLVLLKKGQRRHRVCGSLNKEENLPPGQQAQIRTGAART